jgi:Domain of unknown function (DUF3472)
MRSTTLSARVLAFLGAAFLSACGGGGGGSSSPAPTAPAPKLVISATSSAQLGQVTSGFRKVDKLAVVVKDDKGVVQPGVDVVWSSNDSTAWTYPAQTPTDSNGAASVYWVAGDQQRAAEVTATVTNSAGSTRVAFNGSTSLPITPPRAGHRWDIFFETTGREAATAFRVDVTIEAEGPSTYFSTLGWFGGPGSVFGGYMGLQRGGDLFASQLHFGVWDGPTTKARVVGSPPASTRCDPFGGEGNGVKCRVNYPWAVGDNIRFEVREQVVGGLSRMTAIATNLKTGLRTELATIEQGSKSDMTSTVAFVEPFVVPATESTCARQPLRTMRMENVQYEVGGAWKPFTKGTAVAEEPTTACANTRLEKLASGGLRAIAGGSTSGGVPVSTQPFTLP